MMFSVSIGAAAKPVRTAKFGRHYILPSGFEQAEMIEPPAGSPYYAQDDHVRKRSFSTVHPDGRRFTLDFAVCRMTDEVGPEASETVATLMNAGDAALHRWVCK